MWGWGRGWWGGWDGKYGGGRGAWTSILIRIMKGGGDACCVRLGGWGVEGMGEGGGCGGPGG